MVLTLFHWRIIIDVLRFDATHLPVCEYSGWTDRSYFILIKLLHMFY